MTTVERRIAHLEGRVSEQVREMDGMRESLVSLEARMDRGFEGVDRRFDAIDRRFGAIDRKFDTLAERLDNKMSRQFLWLVGLQVSTLAAILAAVSTLAAR